MKSIIYTTLVALAIVSASAFFFVSSCSAATLIEENFTYPDGSVDQSIFNNDPGDTWYILSNEATATTTGEHMTYYLTGTSTGAAVRFDFMYSIASSSGAGICWLFKDQDETTIDSYCHSVKSAGNPPVLWRGNGTIIYTGYPNTPVYEQVSFRIYPDTNVLTFSSTKGTFSTTTTDITGDYIKYIEIYTVVNGSFSQVYFDNFDYWYDYQEPSIYVVDSPRVYSDHIAKLYPPRLTLCSIGYACYMRFGYSPDAVGLDVNLSLDYTGLPANSLATTTISHEGGLAYDRILLPTQSSFQSLEYDLYLNLNGATGTAAYTDNKVIWAASSSAAKTCDEVDPSDASTWDDFRYGVECAGVKLMKWAFDPTIEDYANFLVAMDTLENAFPFSIIYDLEDLMEELEIATGSEMVLPFMWIDGEPLHDDETDEDVNFLSANKMQDNVFSDIWNNYIYKFMEYMIYLLLVVYFIKRLMTLTKSKA